MIKYIKVDWPESQKFSDNKECYIAIPVDSEDCETSSETYMVPEDLYNKIMNKLEFPKKYENTNLGTIVCYETRAVINGTDTYWYDLNSLEKGGTALIYNYGIENLSEWIVTKCTVCSKGFPILFEDYRLMPGINCEIIGVKNDG